MAIPAVPQMGCGREEETMERHAATRLAIFLPGLYGGGAERTMLHLAGGIAERGYTVDLVLAKAEGPYLREVPETVRVVDLEARRSLASLPALVRYLRKKSRTAKGDACCFEQSQSPRALGSAANRHSRESRCERTEYALQMGESLSRLASSHHSEPGTVFLPMGRLCGRGVARCGG